MQVTVPGSGVDRFGRTPLPVLLVDDSPVLRRFARTALEAERDFTVVGEAGDGRAAVALVAALRPAAVLMDLELPVMGGLEAIGAIMAGSPTPILVFSAFVDGLQSPAARASLAAGAVDVLAKSTPRGELSLADQAEQLRRRMRLVARARVITHPRARWPAHGDDGTGLDPVHRVGRTAAAVLEKPRPPVRLIVLGASTGGPQALLTVLKALPPDLAPAVLVVQHMAEGFIPGLVAWLDGLLPLPVVVGQGGRRLAPGTVTVAPSGVNLLVQDDRLRVLCVPPAAGQFHVPGIDATLSSVARALGDRAVGVVLTGMGRDGALGLRAMRDRGAATLGQDEATSVVYGMPAAAHALGAVETQLPIEQIGPALAALVARADG